jgi:glycosyltransferase involved in cell wall biosynthesis
MFRKFPPLGRLYLNNRLSAIQKKYKFDLWQCTNGYFLGANAVDFFRKNRIPCILRSCGEDIQKLPEINYGYRLNKDVDEFVTEKYPLFDGFVALTQSVKDEYLKLGIDENDIEIIPNGVDATKFIESKEKANKSLFKEFGIDENKPMILTVGRYHPKKGYDQIPAIAKKLKERNVDFQWVVAGRYSDEVKEKYPEAEKLGIITIENFANSGGSRFNLPSQDIVNLYCSADVFALPTLIETFGMVLVEAMAAGLPIVTTEAPGVKHVVSHNENGLKAPVGDIDAIVELICKVLTDKELTKKLSENALKEAAEKYDWKKVTAQYVSFYEKTIGKLSG